MTEDLANLERELIDSGKLIEAGWIGLRIAAIPKDAPTVQLNEMRMAFFAGAQHLFGSIMKALDPDDEVTDDDMRRLDLINAELNLFLVDFKKKHGI
jgi:hypothetical protein